MTIEQMIEFITIDAEAKRNANERWKAVGNQIPETMLLALQAEEACIILEEVQKLYEKTKKEDFGED